MFSFSGVSEEYKEGQRVSVNVVLLVGTLQCDVMVHFEIFHISSGRY